LDLCDREVAVEPVKGLGAEDGVNGLISKRNRLGLAGEHVRFRQE